VHQKLAILAERRQKLILKAAEQRSMLAQSIEPLRKALAIADRGLEIVRYFRQNPILMIGTTALLGIIRPLRYSKWFHTGWVAFRLARNVRRWLTQK
jgi:hypothetical protein